MSSVDSLFEEPDINLDHTSSKKRKLEEDHDHEGCSTPNLIPLDINKEAISIGRLENVTVRLHCSQIPSMISRKHATIVYGRLKRKWNIKDLKVALATIFQSPQYLQCNPLIGLYLNLPVAKHSAWRLILCPYSVQLFPMVWVGKSDLGMKLIHVMDLIRIDIIKQKWRL